MTNLIGFEWGFSGMVTNWQEILEGEAIIATVFYTKRGQYNFKKVWINHAPLMKLWKEMVQPRQHVTFKGHLHFSERNVTGERYPIEVTRLYVDSFLVGPVYPRKDKPESPSTQTMGATPQ